MQNFDSAFKKICELVNDFKRNEQLYLSPKYSEAQVRQDFIDKFFESLGWDIYHKIQKNPYEQEVKVEKGVSVEKSHKRADYAFYISPEFRQPKFFAEAKKPSRSLKNANDYFQTIRYAWSANTPVAVLTDFEEFHILDCRLKPDVNQVLQTPSHKCYRYTDYAVEEKFKEIYFLFSRDSVAAQSLSKYSDTLPKLKGKKVAKSAYQSIDDDFLEYIDKVRETLAKAFKKNDSSLTSEELTEATQRTIDRLVFIRFLEDKQIEPDFIVSDFVKNENPFKKFISVCRTLDAKYNGIVFKKHFIDEQDFRGPEQNTFKKICDEISHENSPYDFNAIPVHILGSIYERFLGKVVNATAQRVKVEEKPEVRKAGGVYYTPKYIVDYIVENTVGKILYGDFYTDLSSPHATTVSSPHATPVSSLHAPGRDPALKNSNGKTPQQISALRFADIACGSGSFLIGVFETLLKYHTEYYQSHPVEAKKDGCIYKDGQWVLSIKQKQKILVNNIYGVDIDPQAVEVTQLSLALKMLEDETTATANEMQALFHEKILPDLSKNIVCGNSLIGTDILQGNMFASEEEKKLNPMDFETTFPEVFKNGGFDAIVGNPPYVKIQVLQESQPLSLQYFKNKYKTGNYGNFDIYVLFLERAQRLLKANGLLGYILPHKFFQSSYGEGTRNLISENKNLTKIIHFGAEQVFYGATTYTCLLFLTKMEQNKFFYYEVKNLDTPELTIFCILTDEPHSSYVKHLLNQPNNNEKWNFTSSENKNLINKINNLPIRLSDVTRKIFVGLQTSADKIYVLRFIEKKINTVRCFSDSLEIEVEIENGLTKPFLMGKDVKRYSQPEPNKVVIFPYNIINGKAVLMKQSEIKENYPMGWNYIMKNKTELENREKGKMRSENFFAYIYPKNLSEFDTNKIMTPYLANKTEFTYDNFNLYHTTKVYSLIFKDEFRKSEKCFLGILNSKLFWFFLKNSGTVFRGGYFVFSTEFLNPFPVPDINNFTSEENLLHDKIVSLVDRMLEAKKQLHQAKTDKDKSYYERRCADLDRQIDAEVYKLYGLTEEEIKIVEGV